MFACINKYLIKKICFFFAAWSSWSDCSKKCSTGTRSRTRSVARAPAYGGASCPSLTEDGACGVYNGGCDDQCIEERGGECRCTQTGYELQGIMNDTVIYCTAVLENS
jgi:hypothetical protein